MVYHKIFQAYEAIVAITNSLFSVRLVAGALVRGVAFLCVCRALARQCIGRVIASQ